MRVVVSKLHVEVDYYDGHEKQKLLAYPSAGKISEVVKAGVDVELAQFLTYYMFYKKRPGKVGYRNYDELAQHASKALDEIEDWVDLSKGTANRAPDDALPVSSITERIGESVGLSVVNEIHSLHEADWNKIPTHPGRRGFKTFDYSIVESASDGSSIVQVETKGTAVADTSVQSNSLAAQAGKAKEKKQSISRLETSGSYKYPASVRYGTVTAIGSKGTMRCYLLDPPSAPVANPRVIRLLSRLLSITQLVSFIAPRSALTAAAWTRLVAVSTIQDPFELMNVPLMRTNGQEFKLERFDGSRHGSSGICLTSSMDPWVGLLVT